MFLFELNRELWNLLLKASPSFAFFGGKPNELRTFEDALCLSEATIGFGILTTSTLRDGRTSELQRSTRSDPI